MMLVVCMIGIVYAKTVAYWPMTKSSGGSRGVVRCAESSDNDLYVGRPTNVTFGANDLDWNLPPNPHTSGAAAAVGGFLVTDMLTSAAKSDAALTNVNANLAKALAPDHDFTIEGWARLTDLPEATKHYIMLDNSDYTTRQKGGWRWRLTRSSEESITMTIGIAKTASDGYNYYHMTENVSPDSLTNGWHHYAVVFKEDTVNSQGIWTFYLDGLDRGHVTSIGSNGYFAPDSISYTTPQVGLVGGIQNGWSPIGDFACWRVSDEALESEQFLCYGGAGTTVSAGKTLNYWKLSGTADGVDGRDFVGTANLSVAANGADAVTDDKPTVPNPDATIGFNGDSGENTGSYRAGTTYQTHNKFLYLTDQAYLEDVLRSKDGWTMEGYFKINGNYGNQYGGIFSLCSNSSSIDGNGVNFALRCYGNSDDDLRCALVDAAVFSTPQISVTDESFSGYLTKDEWTHFALSLSYGMLTNVEQVIYKFYINGDMKSSLTNVYVQTYTKNTKCITFGGTYGAEAKNARSFNGQLSSFRLSKGALEPSEFLCATSSAQPTSDLAYWPLDNANGTADGAVAKGYADYALDKESGTVEGSSERARSRIPAEKGVPEGNAGSVAIETDGSLTAAHLGGDLNFGASWSVEGYLKFNAGSTVDICGTYDAVSGKGWKLVLDRSGETPAFKLYAAAGSTPFINAAFAGTGALDENGWNHLLLTHDKNGTWNLKVNRVDAGTLSSTPHGTGATAGVTDFYIGSGVYDIWRATTGILPLADSLYFPPNGLVITFR